MSGALVATLIGGMSGGGSGGGDATPDALTFTNANGDILALTNGQTLAGINTTISLQVTRTGLGNLLYSKNGGLTPIVSGGTFTAIDGDVISFGVSNGTSGVVTGTVTLTNLSDGSAVLATFTYNVTKSFI